MKLSELSLFELTYSLDYVESVARGAKQMTDNLGQMISANEVTESEMNTDLNKLKLIFLEHDNLSYEIEKELDRRWKKKLKLTNTSQTLLAVNKSITEKIKAREEKKEKPKMKLS